MISLLEVADRAKVGPKMDEKEWNLSLTRKIETLSKEYALNYPSPERYFNDDNGMADSLFDAAVNLLADMGVYCISNSRVIKFTDEEVVEAIKAMPSEIVVGTGHDARRVRKRRIEDRSKPTCSLALHSPFSEDIAPLIVSNFAMIPRMDIIEGFNTPTIDGRQVFSPPFEAYAGMRQLSWMRDGTRKAGKPGMAITYYPISTRASTLLAPMDPEVGLRRSDGILLSILPDNKVEMDYITVAIICSNYGCYRVNGGAVGIVGGFCGGPIGAAIEAVAKALSSWMIYGDVLQNVNIEHFVTLSGAKILEYAWARSIAHCALDRNTNVIRFEGPNSSSELCTLTQLREIAARVVQETINGAHFYIARVFRPKTDGGQTPFEIEFAIEISDAVLRAGIKRDDGREIVGRLSEKFVGNPPEKGKTIRECYDLLRHKPSQEYRSLYLTVKQELTDLGLEFG